MAIFAKVLKYEGDNKTFIWKHPAEDFITGSQLIVHESQEAIFMMNGQVLDTFTAGRYTLDTQNLPIITGIMNITTGGENPFHCELYFINKVEQMAVPWGTNSKIQYLDPEYKFPVEIGASGELSIQVVNSAKLLIKIVGTESILTQDQMVSKLRVFVMKYVKTILPNEIASKHINVFELNMHQMEFSDAIHKELSKEFLDYGLNLVKFSIMNIVLPDEDRNFLKFKELHYRKYNDITEAQLHQQLDLIAQETEAKKTVMQAQAIAQKRALEGYSYQDEKSFEVAKDIANNEATAEFNNLGIGMGMMSGVGFGIGQRVGGLATQSLQDVDGMNHEKSKTRFCPNCGHPVNVSAAFCEECGTKLETSNKCANCGAELSPNSKFCPICGTKRG
ncbi:MAG: SPFH domain-containing protein [Butyrivibrio sp.]|nr:SPFH domain-containing protein [Butyrivibrio sp.]